MNRIRMKFCLLFFFLNTMIVFSRDNLSDSYLDYDTLVQAYLGDTNVLKGSIEYESQFVRNQLNYKKEDRVDIYYFFSLHSRKYGNYEKAYEFALNAFNLSTTTNDKVKTSYTALLLVQILARIGEYSLAEIYFPKVAELFKEQGDYRMYVIVQNQWATFSYQKSPSNSIKMLKACLDYKNFKGLEGVINITLNNLSGLYLNDNFPDSAIHYITRNSLDKTGESDVIYYGNFGIYYWQKGDLQKAISYYDSSLVLCHEPRFVRHEMVNCQDLSAIYLELNQADSALEYFKRYHALSNSLRVNEKGKIKLKYQYEQLKLSHKNEVLKKEEVILLARYNTTRNRYLILIITAISLTLILSIYFYSQRIKSKKEQLKVSLEKEQIEAELQEQKIQEKNLRLELMQMDIQHKSKDIQNYSLELSRRLKFNNEIIQDLKQLAFSLDNDLGKKMKDIYFKIKSSNNANDQVKQFNDHIHLVNQKFREALNEAYPNLSKGELDLCGNIRIGLSIKEVANIRGVSPKSIEMARYRLRKKIGLTRGEDLFTHLTKFSQ